MPLQLRPFVASDAAATLDVFCRAIRVTAAADYSPQQIAAWGSPEVDLSGWSRRRAELDTIVATISETVVGFTDVDADGYIDMMFVDPDYARQGVASGLLQRAIETAASIGATTVSAMVSITARPFFEAHGFVVERERFSVVRGVALTNYAMRRAVRLD